MTDLKEFQRFEQRPFAREKNIPFSDEGPLLELLEFFGISHGSYQPLNFLVLFKKRAGVFYRI